MPTPTSPAPPPESRATLADAIDAIGRGGFQTRDLLPLSDLSRADAAQFARVWASFPDETRERVVREIGELAETNVQYTFGRALRVALSDVSPTVRQLAIAALWEDEGSDLLGLLLDRLERDPDQDVRAESAQGLARFAEMAAAGDLDDEVARRLRETLVSLAGDPGGPYIVRRRALESVAVMDRDDDIVGLIRDAYEDDDAGMRAGALYAMGRSLDAGWMEAILHEFESPDAEMRFEAARASGEIGTDHAIPGLTKLAREDDIEVRQAAIGALGRIGGVASVNALRRLAESARAADSEAIGEALDEALISVDAFRHRTP